MRSSCLASHVMPATPVTETKNCLYISRHTPVFGALVRFPCVGWDLSPSTLEINSLLVFALLWWTCSLGRFGDTGLEHNRNDFKVLKAIYNKPTVDIFVSGVNWNHFLKFRNKSSMHIITNNIQYSFGRLSHSNQRGERNKRIQTGEEVKLSLFADDITLYIENHNNATRKLLEIINEYSKNPRYKINT